MANEETAVMLSPYRVLDLAGEQGQYCGKLLGDLGADVIKVEPPGGDPARRLGPFYHDDPNPEKSLYWFANNTSKRGITLDIGKAGGRDIFRRLAGTADFVIESFTPGYLDGLGLGYADLEKINPGIIFVSITGFGQTGPCSHYKTSALVAWAVGGEMIPFGDKDHPPTRISHHPQAFLHAGADAAAGALTALYQRWQTGLGQQVDVSIQESVVNTTEHVIAGWDLRHVNQSHGRYVIPGHRLTRIWPCRDGYVSWYFQNGAMSRRSNRTLVDWMLAEGLADDFIAGYDWEKFSVLTPQAEIDAIEAPTARFFLAHTRDELFEGALKYDVQLYPVSTTADTLNNEQLKARQFWQPVEHPELGTTINYPGGFAVSSQASPRIIRRAPLIGEHNFEIYGGELGLSTEEMKSLKLAGVI